MDFRWLSGISWNSWRFPWTCRWKITDFTENSAKSCQNLANNVHRHFAKRIYRSKNANICYCVKLEAVQKVEYQMEKKPGKPTHKIQTKKCAEVGRASRKREKLLNTATSTKHASSPLTRRRKRSNKRPIWRNGAAKNLRGPGLRLGYEKGLRWRDQENNYWWRLIYKIIP